MGRIFKEVLRKYEEEVTKEKAGLPTHEAGKVREAVRSPERSRPQA